MSWLVVLRPVRDEMPFEPTEEESRVVSEHYEGPSALPGDTFGLRLFDQDDRAEVEAIVAADPAVTAEIRPYRISAR